MLTGAEYPQAAFAKAWVQLAYGAHHDAITGSESDQVYLDLLTGWRDAWELGCAARDNSLQLLSDAVAGARDSVVVWNPVTQRRSDIVTARLDPPLGAGRAGAGLGRHRGVRARRTRREFGDLAGAGRAVAGLARLSAGPRPQSRRGGNRPPGTEIANEHYRLTVDPKRGGAVASLMHLSGDGGRQLIADGRVGNELAVYEEYPSHPTQGEGPWHLLPKGPVVCSSESPATTQAYHGPLGQRLVVRGAIGTVAALHPDPDAVARSGPGGLPHHD